MVKFPVILITFLVIKQDVLLEQSYVLVFLLKLLVYYKTVAVARITLMGSTVP